MLASIESKLITLITVVENIQKEQGTLNQKSDTIIRLLQDCQTRIGVAETRIQVLQEARKDAAIQQTPELVLSTSQTPHMGTPHMPAAPAKGIGLF